MSISSIVLAITYVFGGEGGVGGSPSKDEGILKKWLDRLADALKRLARKAVEAFPAIVGSVVGTILLDLLLNIRGPSLFCCRTYWCLVDAKGIKENVRWD